MNELFYSSKSINLLKTKGRLHHMNKAKYFYFRLIAECCLFKSRVKGIRAVLQQPGASLRRVVLMLLIFAMLFAGGWPGSNVTQAATPYNAAEAAEGVQEAQPQSWLLKWEDAAQARALDGVKVLGRQPETAVEVICPADSHVHVPDWLERLEREPGVAYVHPNYRVHILQAEQEEAQSNTSDKPAQLEGQQANDFEQAESKPAHQKTATGAEPSLKNEVQLSQAAALSAVQANAGAFSANDPFSPKQSYLSQIGARKAWETAREQTNITIAIVDTGVDLNHPDLKANLVEGYNILSPKKPPMDDNGHGTGVAGVLGAVGNNGLGISGILWKAKLMPIKALDHHGDGTEQDLGEGILQAVRSGAKIVVLSVGLYRYSPYMEDIVKYAESKGVLLVAAAGNDGLLLGSKVAVKYPAAYPTVFAVGGVKPDNTADSRTNSGPELDIAAPWNVYTTGLGGGYRKDEGTSLAAPQVAAAAALVWAQHPKLEPYEVRELLRQTARDIGPAGHDELSGYGLLQIDKAVAAKLKKDAYEPNNRSTEAARLPLQSYLVAELTAPSDQDWFYIDAPAAGEIVLKYESLAAKEQGTQPIRITHVAGGKVQSSENIKLASKSLTISVSEGKQYFQIAFANPNNTASIPYMLTNTFLPAPDPYEPNDKSYEAYNLQPKSQVITGNFHKKADRDWFAIQFTENGKLQLNLSTDTVRIDPGLAIQRAGGQLMTYDTEGEGAAEKSPVISVTPGKYLIRVHNAISTEASPTLGTYTLAIEYTKQYSDPNEPNDKSYQALTIKSGTEYIGVFDTKADVDWFQYRLTEPGTVSLQMSDIPGNAIVTLEHYDKTLTKLQTTQSKSGGKLQTSEQVMQPGVYYVKLVSSQAFDSQYYSFKLQVEPLVAGFSDISSHWARKEIVSLADRGIINGVGNYRFAPDRSITRAEAVAMIVKAYNPVPRQSGSRKFLDVQSTHWANGYIARAVQQGWINGFPDGSFKPDRPITRAEMAVIIGKAEGIKPLTPYSRPFSDVAVTDWHASMIYAMRSSGKLTGVEANVFKPDKRASRAEFTVLLYRFYVQK